MHRCVSVEASVFDLTQKARFYNIQYSTTSEKNRKMKRTFQPNKRKRKKTHGFLVRMRTKGGQQVIKNRRQKGRAKLSV